VELFKVYGFQPKQYEELLKTLKESKCQKCIPNKEESKAPSQSSSEVKKKSTHQTVRVIKEGVINPMDRLQLLITNVALSIIITLLTLYVAS
jgi:SPX domain protein involved in polyphosphate accumulation